jgi:hypothetical protein
MDWMANARPELIGRYRELYRRGAYAPQEERRRLARLVRRGEPASAFRRLRGEEEEREGLEVGHPAPSRAPLQTSLF